MLTEQEQQILTTCDEVFPHVVSFTREMVAQYPVVNQEQAVLDVTERCLSELNMAVKRVNIKDNSLANHPLYAPVEWDYENKYNLVSAINPDSDKPSLVFNGHLDVVPATPFEAWTRLPTDSWQEGDWLYGRGAGDMQSGVAAMIYAVHAVQKAGLDIDFPLTIQAVVEEECTGNGTLACLHQGYQGDFVLIPEPFGPTIYSAQVGVLWFKVSLYGKPAHVLDTGAGFNAIEAVQSLIPSLKQLETYLNKQHKVPEYSHIEHPYNLNVGQIKGGNWASSVPSYAEMACRIGFPVGMTANDIMQLVSNCITSAWQASGVDLTLQPRVRFHGFRSEGHCIDTQNPAIRMLADCHFDLTGNQPEEYISTCTTDLRAFHFYSNTVGTCYGPVAENIHGVDERVSLASIKHTLKTYALFISRWGEACS